MNEPRPGGGFGRTRPFSWSNLLNAPSLLLSCHSPLLLLLYFIHYDAIQRRYGGSLALFHVYYVDAEKLLGFV